MKIGKLPNSALQEIILNKISINNPDVLVSGGIGNDFSALSFGEECCVLSIDPITGTDKSIGRLAVHVSCNDIAASGAIPSGLLVNILAPQKTTKEALANVFSEIANTALSLNVEILGGHTELTTAVNRFVIVTTAIGKIKSSNLIKPSNAKVGDWVILTKTPGIEGISIIAESKETELSNIFGASFVQEAKQFANSISVVREGIICGKLGVNAMHDITEGGLLGAVWEICEASNKGVKIFNDKIPLAHHTKEICNYYNINPLKLISSGCMLICAHNDEEVLSTLHRNNIQCTTIGQITESLDRKLIFQDHYEIIDEPYSDELYNVL